VVNVTCQKCTSIETLRKAVEALLDSTQWLGEEDGNSEVPNSALACLEEALEEINELV
jgi:hypothetical protein